MSRALQTIVSSLVFLVGFLIATTANAGVGQLRVGATGYCVTTSGQSWVYLARCKSGDTGQQWVFLHNGELRPQKDVRRCLDVHNARFVNNQPVKVHSCNGSSAQDWNTNRGRISARNGKCLDVPGGNFRSGVKLIIWDCHTRSNQNITAPRRGTVTNVELADFGFPAFKTCRDNAAKAESDGKCYLHYKPPNADLLPAKFTITSLFKAKSVSVKFLRFLQSQRWGAYTGGGDWVAADDAPTLNVGQRYSLDRCSYFHDNAGTERNTRWPSDQYGALVAYARCLNRVRPINLEEIQALAGARASLFDAARLPARTDGTLPAR